MKPLSSNRELYEYLVTLSRVLEQRNSKALSEVTKSASRQAAGNMSTEFLGESRIALRQVLSKGKRVLTTPELADLTDVLRQIDTAFKKR